MKKLFVFIIAAVMLAAMIAPATVSAYTDPAELTAVGAAKLYVWPADAGTYDPALDGKGIKNGTHVYGCYDFDFTTFVITPKTVPTSLAGYTKVSSPVDMTDGTWCVLTISGAPDYSYVLVMGEPTTGAPSETTPPPTGNVPKTADSTIIAWTAAGFAALTAAALVLKAKKSH